MSELPSKPTKRRNANLPTARPTTQKKLRKSTKPDLISVSDIIRAVPQCNSADNLIELKTFRTQFIRDWVDSLRSTLTDISIVFTPTSISVSEVNASETVFVITKLHASEFERYYSDTRVMISVNAPLFSRTLSRIQDKTIATLFVTRSAPEILNIRIDGEMTATYRFESLDRVPVDIVIPDLTYPVKVSINSQTFAKRLRDMDAVGVRFVRLQAGASNLVCRSIRTSADEHHRGILVEHVFPGAKLQEPLPEGTAEAVVQTEVFPLKFLINFTKQINLSPTVNIYIKSDYPLLVEYILPGNMGYVRYFATKAQLQS